MSSPCVFVVSGLETTFLEYSPSGQVTFRLYLPGYVFTRQTLTLPHHVKYARFLRLSECDMFVEYILSKTIGCTFILLKMTILLIILVNNNFQIPNGKCWFKACVSPSFFGPSTFSSLLWAVEYSIYPVLQKQGKEIHCCFSNYLKILFKLILLNCQDTSLEKHEYMIVVLDSMSSHKFCQKKSFFFLWKFETICRPALIFLVSYCKGFINPPHSKRKLYCFCYLVNSGLTFELLKTK